MKTSNVSRLSFVLALLLGLVTAWCVATPTEITGNFYKGAGCCDCAGASNDECKDLSTDDKCMQINDVMRCDSGSVNTSKCNKDGTYDCGTNCGTFDKQKCDGSC